MKILIDTDLLVEQDIRIEEYAYALLINEGNDGFFQLARYNRKFPIDVNIFKVMDEKALIDYNPVINSEGLPSLMSGLKPSKAFSTITEKEHVSSWIKEWLDMWPRRIKSGGYIVKSNINDVTAKMNRFRKRYPYEKDVIIEATNNYLRESEIKGWSYVKLAKYFILKGDESVLADECESILEDDYSPIKDIEHYGEQEL